jgi:hypothetical protein
VSSGGSCHALAFQQPRFDPSPSHFLLVVGRIICTGTHARTRENSNLHKDAQGMHACGENSDSRRARGAGEAKNDARRNSRCSEVKREKRRTTHKETQGVVK